MNKLNTLLILVLIGIAGFAGNAAATDGAADKASEIMKQSHLAYYYAGNDGIADVSMSIIDKKGKERVREFTMLRRDSEDGGEQKYYTYFKKPSDVSRLTFMVHKNPNGNDSRWIYVPSVDLIKPISADDKNSSFVGSDFSYEDVSGRHWLEDNHQLLGDSTLNDRIVFMIESTPKEAYKGFSRKISFIDKENYLPLREEYYNKKDVLVRIFTAEKIEEVNGINTISIRTMEDVKKKRRTTVSFSNISYNEGLEDNLFTERYLKNPPRQFIK